MCHGGVARWSQRVNEARPRALSHPATAADPGPDCCNEMVRRLLTKSRYIYINISPRTHAAVFRLNLVRSPRENKTSALEETENGDIRLIEIINNTKNNSTR